MWPVGFFVERKGVEIRILKRQGVCFLDGVYSYYKGVSKWLSVHQHAGRRRLAKGE